MTRKAATYESGWDFTKPGQRVEWPYNKWFSAHVGKRIAHAFVREHWDRELRELATVDRLVVEELDPVQVRLSQADHEGCTGYLPFGAQMRQLVDPDDRVLQDYVSRLTSRGLGHSLALLEAGRTKEGRRRLSTETGIPEAALLDLVRRADLTRLRLMSGGMVRQTWVLGYSGLQALKQADPEEYHVKCRRYYSEAFKGKPFDQTLDTVQGHISRMKQAVAIVEE